jgi:uncharacterized membrane protein
MPEKTARHSQAEHTAENTQRRQRPPADRSSNVSDLERLITAGIGLGFILKSFRHRSWRNVGNLLGLALLHRATTGYCPLYQAMGITTHSTKTSDTSVIGRRKVRTDSAVKVEQAIIIQRSSQDLFEFWQNLENLPKVMRHIRTVVRIDDRKSHWTVDSLMEMPPLEWDAEIITLKKDRRIGWQTLPGSPVDHTGSVEFRPIGDGRTTEVLVKLQYDPPGGPIGAGIAKLLGEDPSAKILEDLTEFKNNMESSEHHAAVIKGI